MDRLRKRKKHHRSLYHFSDSASNSDSESTNYGQQSTQPVRSSLRLRNQRRSTIIDDDSDGDTVEPTAAHKTSSINPERIPARTSPRKAKNKIQGAASDKFLYKPKKRKLASHALPTRESLSRSQAKPSKVKPEHIPPWQTLDYQILLKIMQYASYPLYEGSSRDTGSIKWLLDTSALCFSFRDACISTLFFSPPLFPLDRANTVLKLLRSSEMKYGNVPYQQYNQDRISTDYRRKVKSLDIEVRQILLKKQGISLKDLLHHTPLLQKLRMYHNHDALTRDFIWAQPQYAKGKKWNYGDLFEVLDQLEIELTFFEWNGRFLLQDPTLRLLAHAHTQNCLLRTKSLSLLHLGIHADSSDQKMAECQVNMLAALKNMTDLHSLSIRNCDIFDALTTAAMPCTLQNLVIEDCLYITSEAMHDYLDSRGSSLFTLKLLHNRCMSLEFMVSLESMTPKLQHIEIDLTYYDATSFRDTEPLFDSLLPLGPPTWPLNLDHISIGPLRLLTTSDAEKFYDSLVSAASSLSRLRELRLKTILNDTGWRDRALLRSKWTAKMFETFLSDLDDVQYVQNKQKQKNIRTQPSSRTGTCHTVEFELSDQRPAQEQYKEADFLDAEPSDDAEWNGRDESTPSKYKAKRYAW